MMNQTVDSGQRHGRIGEDPVPFYKGWFDHPCDVIVAHAFSRFFRDGAAMELIIRKLRKHGVVVASVSQPSSDDRLGAMICQIIGI